MEVFKPSTYTNTQDTSVLRTLFLVYIPSSSMDDLAVQIKNQESDFYKATTGVPAELAANVDPSYPIDASAAPPAVPGSSSPDSSDTSSASSSNSNVRRDAIIGVCSALGGIALIILAIVVVRNLKMRRERAHHRLSDPGVAVATPGPDHEFDRDSIGGQRRRSFYFAEDSLRGFASPAGASDAQDSRVSPTNAMRERRPVIPGTISAPILRDNTLNW